MKTRCRQLIIHEVPRNWMAKSDTTVQEAYLMVHCDMVVENCSWVSIGVSVGITGLIALLCWRCRQLLVISAWCRWSVFPWRHPLIDGVQSFRLSKWCNFVVRWKTLQSYAQSSSLSILITHKMKTQWCIAFIKHLKITELIENSIICCTPNEYTTSHPVFEYS
jgi:hypothetical protein